MGYIATSIGLLSFIICLSSGTVLRIPLERRQARSVSSPRTGKIVFKNLRNEDYWGSLTIGTPPQKFEAMFDTGSHLLWVPNKRCSNCCIKNEVLNCYKKKNLFDEEKSSTYVDLNRTMSQNYAIGYMRGIAGRDVVNVAGIEVKDQEFATALKSGFQENLLDGVVGLSFTPNRPDSLTTIVDNFLQQKLLQRNIMSFYMNRKGDPKDGGELVLGGWNEKLFDSSAIDYIPVTKALFSWQIQIDRIYFGKEETDCRECLALVDTGSTMITGPIYEVMMYLNKMNAEELENGYYFVKCDTVDSLPDFSFVIKKKTYTLKARDYTFTNSSHPGYCMLGITGHFDTDWVLGIMFLSNYYTIFDLENRKVAFAPLKVSIY